MSIQINETFKLQNEQVKNIGWAPMEVCKCLLGEVIWHEDISLFSLHQNFHDTVYYSPNEPALILDTINRDRYVLKGQYAQKAWENF